MAVSQPTIALFRFLGVSGGTKPTVAADGSALPPGSTYDEQDTGQRWLWDGSLWHLTGLPDFQLQDLAATFTMWMQRLSQQLAGEFLELKQTLLSGVMHDGTMDTTQL